MTNNKAQCPICDANVLLPVNTEVSEIVNCSDCSTRLVVEKINDSEIVLQKAPTIEEDWGE